MAKLKHNLLGKTFGRLTVLKRSPNKSRSTIWLCECECGNVKNIRSGDLVSGDTKSCGCLNIEKLKSHGMHDKPVYITWAVMLQRCNNPNNPSYHKYGGKSVKVCERWLKFENFYEDMGDRPEGMTLDRIAGAKLYSKETCKWSTLSEQFFTESQNQKMSEFIFYLAVIIM